MKQTGKVKWFDVGKGYGFVTAEDGQDYFIHHSGITKGKHYTGLDGADEVTFEVGEGKKGPQAVNVELVPKEKAPATETAKEN